MLHQKSFTNFHIHPFFKWCSENYKQTYIAFENHEFYGGFEVSQTLQPFEINIYPNVRYVNNKSITIGDVELFFTTLWSELGNKHKTSAVNGLHVFRYIQFNGHNLTHKEYDYLFKSCSKWFGNALSNSVAKRKVVVTHYCPTLRFLLLSDSDRYCVHNVDMENLMAKENITTWIHGHTHSNLEPLQIFNTTVVSSQLGYVKY
ncbi:Calcineurin-like phosphoesterase domain-containing protein [Entamoeba marina]